MFENSLLGGRAESQKPWTVAVSLLAQSLLVCVVAIVSLMNAGELPGQRWMVHLLAPPPLLPPAAAKPEPSRKASATSVERFDQDILMQPAAIPERTALIVDTPIEGAAPSPIAPGAPTGQGVIAGNGVGRLLTQLRSISKPAAAPQPDPEPVTEEPRPVSIGGQVQAAKLIHKVEPVYPALARQARITGLVKLQATIAPDGTVRELRVVSGHPLLIQAAVSAVGAWRYRPTLLNGVAVPVVTIIEVRFRLSSHRFR